MLCSFQSDIQRFAFRSRKGNKRHGLTTVLFVVGSKHTSSSGITYFSMSDLSSREMKNSIRSIKTIEVCNLKAKYIGDNKFYVLNLRD